MSDRGPLGAILTAARPRAVAALTRHFRDIHKAEDAFQTACLRALKTWPERGRPDDPLAWLIRVGRNAAIDALRREARFDPLPDELDSDRDEARDVETETIERLENQDYRDDVLRLLFVCCQPVLPLSDQLALALKVVAGLTVQEIARAFLVGTGAMEKRITRAKQKVAAARISFQTPSPAERAERLAAVLSMLYLLFNEGYSSAGEGAHVRVPLCDEAIRLQRLVLRLFPGQSEVMGLLALCLFQHSRARARLSAAGEIVLLENQDRALWDRQMIAEARVLLEKALLKGRPGSYQVQAALAGVHCGAATPEDTDWHEIDRLYQVLEQIQPSPVVTLNRAVAVSKTQGCAAALAMIDPLAERLSGYLYFHGARGALLEDDGRHSEALEAYGRALKLCSTAAETTHVKTRLEGLREKVSRAVG